MSTTIESLELEIKDNAGGAEQSLNRLADTLEKLRNATKGGLGLTAVSKQLTALSNSATGINSNAAKNVEGIAKAISLLSGVKISSSIGNQLTSINKGFANLNLSDGAAKIQQLISVLEPLGSLPKTNLSSFVTPLKKLPEVLADLNKMDMGAFAAKMQDVANAVKPLADEMYKVTQGFSALPSKIQSLITSTDRLSLSNTRASSTFVDLYAKLKLAYTSIKKAASLIATAISKMNDYIENVNLFTVSMGKYADAASEYAHQVAEVMGIDPGEWMRYQGIFMTLATGFGVVGDRAYIMSKQLTQLGYDISSFFNIPYEDAMQKLQSGLSGELEPLRRIGYDLSQAKLEATALSLGIDKAVSSMTQAEKAELRYYAIMTQVTNSHRDMSKTLAAPANQLRIFTSQINQCARAIGSIFIPALNAVLPSVIAIVEVLGEMAKIIANLFGFSISDMDWSDGVTSTGAMTENLDGATDAAKKLKQATMGFDELNVLSQGTESDMSNPLGTGFDFELPEYDFIGKATQSKIGTIVGEMKEWLGITDDIDTWAELFDTRLGNIFIVVGEIGAILLGWKIAKGVTDVIATLKNLGKAGSITLGVSLVIAGITMGAMAIESALTEGLNGVNATALVGASGMIITGGALIGKAFGHALIGAGIAAIIAGVAGLGVALYDAIANELNITNGLVIVFSTALIGLGASTLISTISTGMAGIMGAIVGAAIAGSIWIIQNTEDTASTVGAIVSAAFLAVGAILAFTGVNLPLGIALMAVGALTMGTAIALNTNALSDEVKGVIAIITTTVGMGLLAVGAILAFTAANIPLGIALMAGGALALGTAIAPAWDTLPDSVKSGISIMTAVVGGGLLALGSVLAFSGAAIPLGIALMVLGAAALGTAIAVNWDSIVTALQGPVGAVTSLVGGALLVVGSVLTFSGANIALGIGLMLAGAAALGTAVGVNWDSIVTALQGPVGLITGIISGALLVLGAILLFTGAGIGLGIGLLLAGGAGLASVVAVNWDFILDKIKGIWDGIKSFWNEHIAPVFTLDWWLQLAKNCANGLISGFEGAINGIIGMFESMINWVVGGLNKISFDVPDWVPLIGGKKFGFNIPEVKFSRVSIPRFEEGGFPIQGQMFIARESGAELVGSIGRRTAVVNNDQIVESVSNGVAVANEEQNALLREQNTLLRAMLDKETNTYIDGKKITKSVEKHQRERGRVLVTGGTY